MDHLPRPADNIIQRLSSKLKKARSQGFRVRLEVLDDETASWCVIAGVPTLFIDQSQPASEQLQQLEEILAAYHAEAANDQEQLQPRETAA